MTLRPVNQQTPTLQTIPVRSARSLLASLVLEIAGGVTQHPADTGLAPGRRRPIAWMISVHSDPQRFVATPASLRVYRLASTRKRVTASESAVPSPDRSAMSGPSDFHRSGVYSCGQ